MKRLRDLLFPPRCVLCDEVISPDEGGCCAECRPKLKYIDDPWCLKCGAPIADEGESYCASCKIRGHLFTAGRALYEYPSVRTSIYRFKYSGRAEYAEFYGREMALKLKNQLEKWKPDGLIPIPLYKGRERLRGYNQAERLARAIGRYCAVPVFDRLVFRRHKTRPMKELNVKERQNNLKGAFIIPQDVVKLNRIVLVDDIYTTGATMDSVAGLLLEKGVREVYTLTLAIGTGI
ncbi:MAG: ComF family protein [Lachnospiraceae bacterium]|nr:ComF family protein [Lachnospiraceae bacterium]